MKSRILWAICLSFILSACSGEDFNDQEVNFPNTGHPAFEQETASSVSTSSKEEPQVSAGNEYYISASRLNVRSGPSSNDEIVIVLAMNDKVRIVDDERIGEHEYVAIEILQTAAQMKDGYTDSAIYTSAKYLSNVKNEKKYHANAHKYFMIQNIASEKMRVYEKMCDNGNCQHKMVLETDVAVGEPGKTSTIAGYFHVSEWIKFYQDGAGRYPSWYHPSYMMPPKAGSGVTKWTNSKYLPYKGASMRGAFGWYAAKVAPHAAYQWTHGTLGWGSDKKKFITGVRGFWANLFADPRSHGCTRTDNESIAFIRELVEVGTPIIKVYAKEGYEDQSRYQYSEQKQNWDYILTKNGSRRDGEKSGRQTVLANRTPASQWLEEGSYEVDAYPDAKPFISGKSGAKTGRNANVYGRKNNQMRGIFLVDSGKLLSYSHPSGIKVGGYKTEMLPPFVIAGAGTNVGMPDCPNTKSGDRRCVMSYNR